MKRWLSTMVTGVLVLSSCGGESDSGDSGQGTNSPEKCTLTEELTRSKDVPIGILAPSSSLERQSYASAAEIAAAGLNAVSLGFEFFFTSEGEIVFDFNIGKNDSDAGSDEAKDRWKDRIRCSVIEAKEAGLVVAAWGQLLEAGRRGEPGEMPAGIRTRVLDGVLALMPEMADLMEELNVEYWSPVSELDKFVGPEAHNEYFPKMVVASRPLFTGTMYVQPNILARDGFVAREIRPDLGGVDALGIAWISYECEPEKLPPGQSLAWADYFIDAATEQGITRVFVSELGDTRAANESARPCVEKLIDYWDGRTSGVFMLDMPSDSPNGASIKGSWQEDVLKTLR